MNKKFLFVFATILSAMLIGAVFARASGATKIVIWDNTQDGVQVDDPVIGFVVFNQDANGRLIIEVSLKKAMPNVELTVELVTLGTNPNGGLDEWGHSGSINLLGTITTNGVGNGNAHFALDSEMLATLIGTVAGVTNYGHIDLEDYIGGQGVGVNQYGAPVVQWEQPA